MHSPMKAIESILAWVQENNPDLYNRYCMAKHEEEHGAHFDKAFAIKAVAEMYHTAPDGSKRYGERWTIDEVKAAVEPFRGKMHDKDNYWDAYVAVHMWWHDLGRNYKQRDPNNYEAALIEDAVTWAFCDEDAPDGKIWHYIQAMK